MSVKYKHYNSEQKVFSKKDFGENFKWGVAAAAFQTEGSPYADGKKASIWDTFSSKKGKIYKGHTAEISCDFYKRYEQDIELMKSMNIPNFRFSLSWSRIFPEGIGAYNQEGIDFYNRIINKCLELNIEPWITIYHWDLPEALEKKGGWANREIIAWFSEYVKLCAKAFGDRVKHWMVLNEPLVFTGAGYFLGIHAPGKKGIKKFIPAMHHATICQAQGGRIIRETCPQAKIGTTFSCSQIDPYRTNNKDKKAAKRVDALINRLFLEPALGLGYPEEDLRFLKRLKPYFLPGDREMMTFEFDFIGLQNYTREVVKHAWLVPYVQAMNIKARKRKVPITEMEWEVYPKGIYKLLKKFSAYKGVKKIYITENGAAFPDKIENGKVHDTDRVYFLKNYLKQVLKAKKEGVEVNGYFVWSLTDNFEWAEGYRPRFGLVYIDFDTQKRIVKSSGRWFKNFLKHSSCLI